MLVQGKFILDKGEVSKSYKKFNGFFITELIILLFVLSIMFTGTVYIIKVCNRNLNFINLLVADINNAANFFETIQSSPSIDYFSINSNKIKVDKHTDSVIRYRYSLSNSKYIDMVLYEEN